MECYLPRVDAAAATPLVQFQLLHLLLTLSFLRKIEKAMVDDDEDDDAIAAKKFLFHHLLLLLIIL